MIGVLHPGQMGAAVGAALRSGGSAVGWCSQGRTAATCERAELARLEDVGDLPALLRRSESVFSVCPPHAALELARAVAGQGFAGTFVDANAVSPATARDVAEAVESAGARYVDGGIVGPPPRRPGSTRLYLSGAGAPGVAALFSDGPLEAVALDGPVTSASALKMAYAGWTKGSSALLMAIRALAAHEGVEEALLNEWQRSIPELPARSEGAARLNAPKAWRFRGEMKEIAATLEAAGLPPGFHLAAAELYDRLEAFKDIDTPALRSVLAALLASREEMG